MFEASAFDPLVQALAVPAAVLDERADISCINGSFTRAAGTTRQETLGRPFFASCAALQGLDAVEPVFRHAVADGVVDQAFQVTLPSPGGDTGAGCNLRMRSFRQGGRLWVLLLLEADDPALLADEAERTFALRQEASRIKHTLNNLLMGLLGHADIMRSLPGLDERAQRKAEQVLEHTRRLQEGVQDLNRISGSAPLP